MSALPGLIGRMSQTCARLVPEPVPDGHGGVRTTWREAGEFQAAVSATGGTDETDVATRPDSVAACVLTCPRGIGLAFHDRVRTSDGRLLLVTSEAKDRHTPTPATFEFERLECEEVVDG